MSLPSDLLRGLTQPDQRTCGPSSLVAARMLLDPSYAKRARSRFAEEVLALHRQITGPVGAGGAAQLPWPRALGTPPWAVAAAMSAYGGRPFTTALVRVGDRAQLPGRIREALAAGLPVPLYVGDAWLPRHVVLAVDRQPAATLVYNPARGQLDPMSDADLASGTLRTFGRWSIAWLASLPE